jgi:DNA-binding transcriptional ArsR family regulator
VNPVLRIAKALSDETRLRALLALRDGELCLCHVVGVLELAPSTVSKHLDILCQAGLVRRRKDGRWCYFRLAERDADPVVRSALRWVLAAGAEDVALGKDLQRVASLRRKDLQELAACYRS